jgi:hypothetical protein
MSREDGDLSDDGLGLVKDAELAQDGAAIVVNSLSGEAIITVERVHPAKWELNPSSGGGEAAPGAEVRPANHNLHQDRFVGHVAPLNVDHEIGQRSHQLSVKSSDAVPALMVFIPRLIVVLRGIAKGSKNAFEIMLVLAPYVLFDQCDPG